jgi:hypothetical protein
MSTSLVVKGFWDNYILLSLRIYEEKFSKKVGLFVIDDCTVNLFNDQPKLKDFIKWRRNYDY